MNRPRIKPIYAALGVAVLGLLVMPIAFAGAAANSPKATVRSTVARLEHRISRLQNRVDTLERKGSGPAGPAGGALQGSYPNPGLGSGAVTEGNIAPGAVGTRGLGDNSVTNAKLGANAVSSRNIAAGAIGAPQLSPGAVDSSSLALGAVDGGKLAPGAVGGATLANTFPVQGRDQFVNAGHTEQTSVSCPPGSRLLSGGAEWSPNSDDNTAIISSSPSFTGDPTRTWVVQGRVDRGGAARDHLFAEALCLDV
jgi:hypothetical protein